MGFKETRIYSSTPYYKPPLTLAIHCCVLGSDAGDPAVEPHRTGGVAWLAFGFFGFRSSGYVGAQILAYTIFFFWGVPYYEYAILGPKTIV